MDTVTLVIAVVGLVLSVASLTWQVSTFLLSGARVRCELRHVGVAPGRTWASVPPRNPLRLPPELTEQGFTDERLAVIARNVGRLPVSVERYALMFGAGINFGSVRPESHEPQLPHRLEPGEQATWMLSLAEARDIVSHARKGPQRAWMTVELGNGKTVRTRETAVIEPLS